MKLLISHSNNYDFQKELYDPVRSSSLHKEHEVILPHEDDVNISTKEIIQGCDLIVAEVSYPSTGQGIELGWADVFKIPVVCMHKEKSRPSLSLGRIANDFLVYTDTKDMIVKLEQYILQKRR